MNVATFGGAKQTCLMDHLPKDPAILVSSINMLLRDGEFDSLEQLCQYFHRDESEVKQYLHEHGFVYSEEQKQMRPTGYDAAAIGKDAIESAYCFFRQKLNIYLHSDMEWQKDDIEYAIAQYADRMNPSLLKSLGGGRPGFLHEHSTFADDLQSAVNQLEALI